MSAYHDETAKVNSVSVKNRSESKASSRKPSVGGGVIG